MSTPKTVPACLQPGPHGIDLTAPGGIDRLIEYHRRAFGDARMEGDGGGSGGGGNEGPQRPDGITDAEWAALGDPGKAALVREREARAQLERDLAAARARPTPPKETPKPQAPAKTGEQPDVAAFIAQAVEAALKPFQEREEKREADAAANTIREAVVKAAEGKLHDPSDALAHIDLTTLVGANAAPDTAKIDAAIADLATRKPHLAKVLDNRRTAAPGSVLSGGGAAQTPIEERTKATLARMQAKTGVKFAGQS